MSNIYGFNFKRISNGNSLKDIYKLRYKVYVEEWGYEKPEDHPEGVEADEYDEHSIHFMAFRYDQLIGTIRIIQNSEKGFPIERHCKIDFDTSGIDRNKIGEISRLAVSKDFRRRVEDRFLFQAVSPDADYKPEEKSQDPRRRRQEIVIGLYKSMYNESKKIGLTHWYAVMAKALYLILHKMGISFKPIGPETDYHGLRVPYILCIEEIEKMLAVSKPELFREFAEGTPN